MPEMENDHNTTYPTNTDNKSKLPVWNLSEEAQDMLNMLIDQLAYFCEANKLPFVVAAQIEQAENHVTGYLFLDGNMDHTHSPMMLHLATVARILLNTDMDISLDYLNTLDPIMDDFMKRHPQNG